MPPVGGAPTDRIDPHSFFQFGLRRERNSTSTPATPSVTDSPAASPTTLEHARPVRRPLPARLPPTEAQVRSVSPRRVGPLSESPQALPSRRSTRPTEQLRRTQTTIETPVPNQKKPSSVSEYARIVLRRFSLTSSSNLPSYESSRDRSDSRSKKRESSQPSGSQRWEAISGTADADANLDKSRIWRALKGLVNGRDEIPNLPQMLRPPAKRDVSAANLRHHTVNIETEFPEPEAPKIERRSLSRRASRSGRRALDRSMRLVRDQYGYLRRVPQEIGQSSTDTRTEEVLRQVSGTLSRLADDSHKPARKNVKLFSGSPISDSSGIRLEPTLHRTYSNFSESSSIRELRRGINPGVSPNPESTYRARLRRDGPSEEFMRVNLLDPDGPSYLPSEARRVHTPPLPGEGPHQKRRGFFFDYNAPQNAEAEVLPFLAYSDTKRTTEDIKAVTRAHRGSTSDDSQPISISKRYTQKFGPGQRKKQGDGDVDWYEQQLLEFDRQDRRDREAAGAHGNPATGATRRNRRTSSVATSHIRASSASDSSGSRSERALGMRRAEHEEIDYRIPDHYPSSPLCPRHPKHEMKGMRVCWMHGRNPPSWKPVVELKVGGIGQELVCYRSGRGEEVLCYRGNGEKLA
ncbi:accessory factor associated with RNA polymerase II [Mycoblastus sanguinarius]|nr:accessory factor associated with RNA polymerase II [Mycoblastus sanguinarius]